MPDIALYKSYYICYFDSVDISLDPRPDPALASSYLGITTATSYIMLSTSLSYIASGILFLLSLASL